MHCHQVAEMNYCKTFHKQISTQNKCFALLKQQESHCIVYNYMTKCVQIKYQIILQRKQISHSHNNILLKAWCTVHTEVQQMAMRALVLGLMGDWFVPVCEHLVSHWFQYPPAWILHFTTTNGLVWPSLLKECHHSIHPTE